MVEVYLRLRLTLPLITYAWRIRKFLSDNQVTSREPICWGARCMHFEHTTGSSVDVAQICLNYLTRANGSRQFDRRFKLDHFMIDCLFRGNLVTRRWHSGFFENFLQRLRQNQRQHVHGPESNAKS